MLGNYYNLNLADIPVGKNITAVIVAAVLFPALALIGVLAFSKMFQIPTESRLEQVMQWFREKFSFLGRRTSLFFFEWYKLLIQQKKWLLLLLLLLWGGGEVADVYGERYYATEKETAYHYYLNQMSGKVTAETYDFIAGEQEVLDKKWQKLLELKQNPTNLSAYMQQQIWLEIGLKGEGFEMVKQQLSALEQKEGAVEDFNVIFTPGIHGLLGPNGAGKSTLMNIITQNLKADAGTITLDGKEISGMGAEYRKLLGYMPQQQGIYDDFTGEMFLWYMASLKGMNRKEAKESIEKLLQVVNLKEARNKKMKAYSGGMKQRILIAQALLNDPKILIMDEPTAGLDPKERIRIRNFISEISKDKIVLLATHVVSDIEFIAKEILVMGRGRIIAEGTAPKLLSAIEDKVFEVLATEEEQKYYEENGYKISNVSQTLGKVSLRVISDEIPKLGEVQKLNPNLEDLYLYLVEDK